MWRRGTLKADAKPAKQATASVHAGFRIEPQLCTNRSESALFSIYLKESPNPPRVTP